MTIIPDSPVNGTEPAGIPDDHYAQRWVKAGLLSLTGGPDKPVAKGHRMLVPFDHLVAELETVSVKLSSLTSTCSQSGQNCLI